MGRQRKTSKPLDLDSLSFPYLHEARSEMLDALISLCRDSDNAAATLGIGHTQLDQVALNAELRTAATLRAEKLYTGVLYDNLDLATLPTDARRRASRRLAITSSLFGVVRLGDALPSYRLPGGTTLPGLGSVAGHWRGHLEPALQEAIGNGLFVDLRSSTYAAFWRVTPEIAARTATVRVLHEVNGQRKVVSHFNKATKGRLVRSLLLDAATPKTPLALAQQLTALGWSVEIGKSTKSGVPLDVIVSDL